MKNPQGKIRKTSEMNPRIYNQHCNQVEFFIAAMDRFTTQSPVSVIHQINRLQNKNYMVISINAEKALDKTLWRFMIKTLKLRLETNDLSLKENLPSDVQGSIVTNGETIFPL